MNTKCWYSHTIECFTFWIFQLCSQFYLYTKYWSTQGEKFRFFFSLSKEQWISSWVYGIHCRLSHTPHASSENIARICDLMMFLFLSALLLFAPFKSIFSEKERKRKRWKRNPNVIKISNGRGGEREWVSTHVIHAKHQFRHCNFHCPWISFIVPGIHSIPSNVMKPTTNGDQNNKSNREIKWNTHTQTHTHALDCKNGI